MLSLWLRKNQPQRRVSVRAMRADLILLKGFVTFLCFEALSITALRAQPAAQQVPEPRGRGYDRLSSGALMLRDRNGDLVQPPARRAAKSEQSFAEALVALDRRVGANIRLGDDPSALPSVMRAQAEPHIARSPANPDFLVAVFQEGRFAGPGAVDCGYSISR